MSALMIKDLSVAEELDSKALKSVRGGYLANPLFPSLSFMLDNSKTINGPQFIQQHMNITNVGGNNSTIIPMMTAGNSIVMN
ncbi:conserved hypothetical protein [Paraburkholderia piptadeniae]|uniref:Uncharacterized protein n=1 Tax=Paraburkholderia piptadeniae TaxID=1701573 RepID=A0A1N7SSG4_9BURK|nr:hypothetical protein [Paraburkholderia piptadeniae]SIT50302.1 conserved hypothetical protein [Paraburkholderia piptadeniae]